jgi:hypothetical protein
MRSSRVAADEAVLNKVHMKKVNPLIGYLIIANWQFKLVISLYVSF